MAETAIATFANNYAAKYDRAVTYLMKDRDAVLTVYNFPPSIRIICGRRTD